MIDPPSVSELIMPLILHLKKPTQSANDYLLSTTVIQHHLANSASYTPIGTSEFVLTSNPKSAHARRQ